MTVDIQRITAHVAGDLYYLLHNDTTSYPVSMVRKIHTSPPFSKESMRVLDASNPDNTAAVLISDAVSAYTSLLALLSKLCNLN